MNDYPKPINWKGIKHEEMSEMIGHLYREVGLHLIDYEGKRPNKSDRVLLRDCCYALDILLDEIYVKNYHIEKIEKTIKDMKGWKYAGHTDNSQ